MTQDEAEKLANRLMRAHPSDMRNKIASALLRIADEQWNAALDAAAKAEEQLSGNAVHILALKREAK